MERIIAKGGVHPPSQGTKPVEVGMRSDLKTSDAITEDIGRRGRDRNEEGFEEDPEPETKEKQELKNRSYGEMEKPRTPTLKSEQVGKRRLNADGREDQ